MGIFDTETKRSRDVRVYFSRTAARLVILLVISMISLHYSPYFHANYLLNPIKMLNIWQESAKTLKDNWYFISYMMLSLSTLRLVFLYLTGQLFVIRGRDNG